MSTTQFTVKDACQYVRLTLKQYGFHDYSCVFFNQKSRCMGYANPWEKKIGISKRALNNFDLLRHITLHEIAHVIQFQRQGNTYIINGRRAHHNSVFNQICVELGIPKGRFIPRRLLTHA